MTPEEARKRLAAALAGSSGAPLEEVRGLLGEPAGATSKPATRVRAPAALVRAQEQLVNQAAEPLDNGAQERPRKRALKLDSSAVRKSRFATVARGRGTPSMDGLDWAPEDFAAYAAIARSRFAFEALLTVPRCYAQRVERAALAMVRDPSTGHRVPTRDWTHVRARRIVALAVVLWRASKPSKRSGMARILVGRSRGMIANLTKNPATLAPYSVSMLFATQHHHGGGIFDCGDVEALDRTLALWRHQPPASCVDPRFCGRDRDGNPRAFAEYHFTERNASNEPPPEDEPEDAPHVEHIEPTPTPRPPE